MKNSLGKPEFIVRLSPNDEKKAIELSKQFNTSSYAKTLIAANDKYLSEVKYYQAQIREQNKQLATLSKALSSEIKYNQTITKQAKYLQNILNKVVVIKNVVNKTITEKKKKR